MKNEQVLSNAQRVGILQEIRSYELSEEQELHLFNLIVADERRRQGIPIENPQTEGDSL